MSTDWGDVTGVILVPGVPTSWSWCSYILLQSLPIGEMIRFHMYNRVPAYVEINYVEYDDDDIPSSLQEVYNYLSF